MYNTLDSMVMIHNDSIYKVRFCLHDILKRKNIEMKRRSVVSRGDQGLQG